MAVGNCLRMTGTRSSIACVRSLACANVRSRCILESVEKENGLAGHQCIRYDPSVAIWEKGSIPEFRHEAKVIQPQSRPGMGASDCATLWRVMICCVLRYTSWNGCLRRRKAMAYIHNIRKIDAVILVGPLNVRNVDNSHRQHRWEIQNCRRFCSCSKNHKVQQLSTNGMQQVQYQLLEINKFQQSSIRF